jgi:hypothetical protein
MIFSKKHMLRVHHMMLPWFPGVSLADPRQLSNWTSKAQPLHEFRIVAAQLEAGLGFTQRSTERLAMANTFGSSGINITRMIPHCLVGGFNMF